MATTTSTTTRTRRTAAGKKAGAVPVPAQTRRMAKASIERALRKWGTSGMPDEVKPAVRRLVLALNELVPADTDDPADRKAAEKVAWRAGYRLAKAVKRDADEVFALIRG